MGIRTIGDIFLVPTTSGDMKESVTGIFCDRIEMVTATLGDTKRMVTTPSGDTIQPVTVTFGDKTDVCEILTLTHKCPRYLDETGCHVLMFV